MKIQNALVSNILYRSQRYVAHVTTVTLSWRVQNIVVIGRVYFILEGFEFSSNFEFDRNMLSGTGARSSLGTLKLAFHVSWALYYSDLTLSQEFQPKAAQLSMKAALPLAKILTTVPCRSSNTGPSAVILATFPFQWWRNFEEYRHYWSVANAIKTKRAPCA